jgi:PAS domain S-box-containing protein
MKQNHVIDEVMVSTVQEILQSEYLRESNVLNLLPSAVYVCDRSGIIVSYNRKAVELWGRTPKKGDKDERYCGSFKLYCPDGTYLPHDKTPVVGCLADGLPRKDFEVIMERPDQSRIIARVNIVPIKDEKGSVLGMINCFYDITQERKMQKELDWKTRELQDYVENAAIGLHWVDADGIIKWANAAELDMLGYTADEYIGHHISEFHVEQTKIDDILKRLSCNETLNGYESILRCKDGSTRNVQISSNVFWDEGKFIHTRCFTIDVTEQKKLFCALKESEEKYRQLVHSLQTAVYTTDENGVIRFYNQAAADLWGRQPAIGKDLWCGSVKAFTADGQSLALEDAPMAQCLKKGKNIKGQELIIERPDGTRRTVIPYPTPLFNPEGKLYGAINIIVDITERKMIERSLHESELQYRQLIQSLQAAVYTTDTEGRIMLYNEAAADLWGREPEIGKDLWCGSFKIFKPDGSELPLDSCPMAVCLKEGRPVYGEEILVVRPDGSLRNVAPHPQPLYDDSGQMIGAINMLVDITEIKRTEKALRESEARYRELALSLEKKVEEKTIDLKNKNEELRKSEERYHKMVEEVEDYAIILLDKDGIVQNWNKGAEKIKGYKEEEIIGKSFSSFYLQEDRENGLHKKLLEEARQKGKTLHEGWRLRKNGSRFWASVVFTALHDSQNNIIGFSKVTRDLTERKLAEDKMAEYMRQLEFQNKELEQFAYAASHDMKEPLRKVQLYYSSISENPANILDERSREFLNRSVNAIKRMNDLIEDLLAYSKTTSMIENFEEVDLKEVVEEITLLHKGKFEHQGVQIDIGSLPTVHAIQFQMKQLMGNLISNAVKYRKPGEAADIRIVSELVKGSDIKNWGADESKSYHKISVTDNGIGFNMQYAEKIFDLFQRLTNLPGASGSGVGLAICKRIAQNHHGFIKANGTVGHGARFDIYLPKKL